MNQVYLNGRFLDASEAAISPLDRGFLFADGVYEVVPVYSGQPFRLDDHLDRLSYSLTGIELANPYPRDQWRQLINELIGRNGAGNQAIYLQVTRGAGAARNHGFPPATAEPTIFAMSMAVTPPAADKPDFAEGVAAVTRDDIRWSRCDIKSVSLLPNILLRQQAEEVGAAEAILVRDGFVTEGSASNIFVVTDSDIATPPRSHAILGGITRDLVIELSREQGTPISEREISETELSRAREIWLTSSTREVVPVVQLNGMVIGDGQPGTRWYHMARHFVAFKRALCGLE